MKTPQSEFKVGMVVKYKRPERRRGRFKILRYGDTKLNAP